MDNNFRAVNSKHPVFVTKYALSVGIQRFTSGEFYEGYFTRIGGTFVRRSQWFRTETEAQEDAKRQAARKLKSIDKQRARILQIANEGASVS